MDSLDCMYLRTVQNGDWLRALCIRVFHVACCRIPSIRGCRRCSSIQTLRHENCGIVPTTSAGASSNRDNVRLRLCYMICHVSCRCAEYLHASFRSLPHCRSRRHIRRHDTPRRSLVTPIPCPARLWSTCMMYVPSTCSPLEDPTGASRTGWLNMNAWHRYHDKLRSNASFRLTLASSNHEAL